MSKSNEEGKKVWEQFLVYASMIFPLLVTSTEFFHMFNNTLMIISQLYHLCE